MLFFGCVIVSWVYEDNAIVICLSGDIQPKINILDSLFMLSCFTSLKPFNLETQLIKQPFTRM